MEPGQRQAMIARADSRHPAILFVCLGNICRSPLAEAAFRDEAATAGLVVEVDSAGTGHWHVGKPPDPRAQAVARANGVDIGQLRGRQVDDADYRRFDHILAMDHDNLQTLRARAPDDATAQIALLLDQVPGREGDAVADPYYGGDEGFSATWSDVSEAAQHLVRRLSAA